MCMFFFQALGEYRADLVRVGVATPTTTGSRAATVMVVSARDSILIEPPHVTELSFGRLAARDGKGRVASSAA